ncbi:MAG: type II toxin-antitoxin system VapC family toxin [Devosia sp.]
MLGVDSNVLIRFFTRDDEKQFEQASRVFDRAADHTLFLSVIVMVEVNWALRRGYKRARNDVLQTLEDLVQTRQFVIEDRENVISAIAIARATKADFSDALIALRNEVNGCSETATFDHDALDIGQMTQVGALLK